MTPEPDALRAAVPQPHTGPSAGARSAVLRTSELDAARALHLAGRLVLDDAAELWTDVRLATRDLSRGQAVRIDLSEIAAADGGSIALLAHIRRALIDRGVRAEIVGADPNTAALIKLQLGRTRARHPPRRKPEGVLAEIGRSTLRGLGEVRDLLGFVGETALSVVGVVRAPRTGNSRDLFPTMERMGVNAVPIVALITFLTGFVLAYIGSTQLRQFGANIYVADLVGLSITREMGPLMTAVLLCSRSGAGFAAEIGSMKVGEEIDALRTMGFGPIRYLVQPRVLALVLVAPILTLLADVAGLLGGLVVGVTSLDLSAHAYLLETQRALTAWDVFSGLAKSVAFALAISLVACQQGLATTGGAEGVGRRTTAAVVLGLLSVILIDAAFTLAYRLVGL